MQTTEKKCGEWGDFLAGDRVSCYFEEGNIATKDPADVPSDYVPMKFDFNGAILPVPKFKVARIRLNY